MIVNSVSCAIKFTVVDLKVDALPRVPRPTKGRFPENMPGPLQSNGIKAFMINASGHPDGIVEPGC